MKYIDITVNLFTLISGIVTAILGYLLYLKYRVKAIRHYALFILTTTFTVAATTVNSYLTNSLTADYQSTVSYMIGFLLFQVFLICINYSFSLFARSIIHRSLSLFHKVMIGISCFFWLFSVILLVWRNMGKDTIVFPLPVYACFGLIVLILFLVFVINSIQIALNLKIIDNPDLKRALKALALTFVICIPIQTMIILVNREWVVFMLSRNILYLAIDIVSVLFAAKYFFIQAPTIMDAISVSQSFVSKYAITTREKEVIKLLLKGLSIKEVAAALDRSFKTVNNHIYNIYQKTGAGNKIELLNLIKENQIG